ncbi:MAG: FHA domain-containing protein [Thermoanaerobaculia bacterium]
MPVRFGKFVFDVESHELLRGSAPVRVSPKAFRLLEVLIDRRPAVVTKQQLLDEVWEGQIVEEENVKNLIAELRKVLDDGAGHPVIRTVHRMGYSFCAEAVETSRAEKTGWSLNDGTTSYPISSLTLIGRSSECAIRLRSDSVSRVHARITVDGETPTIEDLGSKNGTQVAGQRIAEATRLSNGDIIRIGSVSLTVFSYDFLATRTIPPQ